MRLHGAGASNPELLTYHTPGTCLPVCLSACLSVCLSVLVSCSMWNFHT